MLHVIARHSRRLNQLRPTCLDERRVREYHVLMRPARARSSARFARHRSMIPRSAGGIWSSNA
jgi:hypothetical protein